MNRIKLLITLLITFSAFSACKQTYTCHCAPIPGVTQISNARADEEIKARNRDKAADKCDDHDNASVDCSVL